MAVNSQILFIDSETPSTRDAGRLNSLMYIRALHAFGYKVDVLVTWGSKGGGEEPGISYFYAEGDLDAGRAFLRVALSRASAVVVCRLDNYIVLSDELAAFQHSGGKVVFVTVDLHFLRESRLVKRDAPIDREVAYRRLERAVGELSLVRRADACVVVSDFEGAYLRLVGIGGNVWTIPLAHDVADRVVVPESSEPRLLFVGSFMHAPNVDGLRQFLELVWPEVLRSFPYAELDVIGQGGEMFARDGHPNVRVHGWVADVEPYYRRAWASIAPLSAGAGLKGKVVASLASGVPVLGSDVALEGFAVEDLGEALFTCSGASEYVEALRWLTGPGNLELSREHALAAGVRRFSLERLTEDLRTLFAALGI